MAHPHDPHRAARDSALMTKVLAVLLLLVAGALVFTVVRQRGNHPASITYEPRAVTPVASDLGADEKSTIMVFEEVSPSVVHITNLANRRDAYSMDITEIPRGTGSGFVWDEAGNIVTNFHVIEDADSTRVTLYDGSTYTGTVVGYSRDKDLAVVKIDAPPSKLHKIAIGVSSDLKVGQKVLAIGNPFGLDQTLTTGVISGLGREIKSVTQRTIFDVIQTDASINPGNSGGPLLDSHGRLIGVNTAIFSPSGASAGIGFAVPVDTVQRIVPQILQHKRVVRPVLGINIASDQMAKQLNVTGILILGVSPTGPSARAGLVGITQGPSGGWILGDVIVAIDGTPLARSNDLFQVLDKRNVGDLVTLEVTRNGQRRAVEVKLEAGT